MGGPGGFGRGRRGPGQNDEDREAERKRRMEERKFYKSLVLDRSKTEPIAVSREETSRSRTDSHWSQEEKEGSRAVYQVALE